MVQKKFTDRLLKVRLLDKAFFYLPKLVKFKSNIKTQKNKGGSEKIIKVRLALLIT